MAPKRGRRDDLKRRARKGRQEISRKTLGALRDLALLNRPRRPPLRGAANGSEKGTPRRSETPSAPRTPRNFQEDARRARRARRLKPSSATSAPRCRERFRQQAAETI